MIRLATAIALLPPLAWAAGGEMPATAVKPAPDAPIVLHVTIPAARHQFPTDITDRMRAALVMKMGGAPPPEATTHEAEKAGH